MTEKERKIFNAIKQLKVDYPYFYKGFKWISILIIAIPIFIWISYRIGHFYVLIPTDTSEGELLAFYGTILSFISTLGLGALALWQNIKANNINDRLSLIEEKRFKLELQPFVVVTGGNLKQELVSYIWDNPTILSFEINHIPIDEEECAFLTLEFQNTSNTYIMMNYLTGKLYRNGKCIETLKNYNVNLDNSTLYLESGQKGTMGFILSLDKIKEIEMGKIQFEFLLKNRFNDCYKETIEIIILIAGDEDDDIDNSFVTINAQNYKIQKFNNQTNKYEDD